jgi:penicillin-binding protein 1A
MSDLQQRIAAIRQRLESIERAHPNALLAAWITTLIVVVAILGGSAWLVYDIFHDLPSASELRDIGSMAQATTLYDRNNQPAFTIFQERRIERPLSDISPHLVDAVIAVEDQRFYEHRGIDLIRIFAAAAANLREHRAAQGGSTLTQQLARQSFLTSDKTLRRKVKEAILAWRLEREFTKQQLLEMYLNKVYFGDGLYGVEAASLGFFGKHARDVDVAEAALLAGLVKSPSTYAPTINLERAVARRNVVLQAMLDSSAIDAATYQMALRSQPHLADALRSEETFGQYFKEEVRKQLVQRFGWERVYIGGLKVYTTLDPAMQQAAEAEVARSLAEIEKRQLNRAKQLAPSTDPLQAALVAIDPTTGEVRAMVGGRNFDQSRFNRATQARRQAGSAFKPFVYASALEQGFTPATVITGLDNPIATLQGAWVPDDHGGSGAMTMRAALKTSSNRAAVQMLQQIGIPTAVRYAERLGVGGLPEVPSLALGSGEVTLMSMTAAYSAFANQGMFAQPSLIRRVDDSSGQVLYASSTREEPSNERGHRVHHDVDDVGRDQWRHGVAGASRRLHAASRREDRNDERLSRCVVRRLHAASGDGCVDWLRHAANDHRQRICGRTGRAAVGPVHDGGDTERQTGSVHDAGDRRPRHDLSTQRQAADRRVRIGRDVRSRWESDRPLDAVHGIFRPGYRADRLLSAPSRARRARIDRRRTDGICRYRDVRERERPSSHPRTRRRTVPIRRRTRHRPRFRRRPRQTPPTHKHASADSGAGFSDAEIMRSCRFARSSAIRVCCRCSRA